ncbi:DUF4013 domain-containing protein [Nanoarchaeota archaeon]
MTAKTINDAIAYPFKNWTRIFNFLWVLTGIGVIAFTGYILKIINNIVDGKTKELPAFNWEKNLLKGWGFTWYGILISIPITAIYLLIGYLFGNSTCLCNVNTIGIILSVIFSIILIIYMPMLCINYCRHRRVKAGFDFSLSHKLVFGRFGDYLMTLLKSLVVLIFMNLCLFPVKNYNQMYLLADFYKRNMKVNKPKNKQKNKPKKKR